MTDRRPPPWQLGLATCAAMVPLGNLGQPRRCPGDVTHTGLTLREGDADRPVEVWQTFTCTAHAEFLIAPRLLLERDREVRRRRAAESDRWRPGHPNRPAPGNPWVRPEPLARGAAARELVERARRFATS